MRPATHKRSPVRTIAAVAALLGTLLCESVAAQAPGADLAQISLEDLMRVEIVAAGRKEQRADTVPGAAYVLTDDDIRRSGMRTLPDVLRLVPGVQVAQVNSSRWAVSIRGFNNLYANKLLVLIDGRSLYNRAFSGVFWDGQDVLLEDIARIEVIRGPGGAIWGANAVNGVINIVTKPAAETRGGLVRVSAGTFERGGAAVRYGGSLGPASYRVFSQWAGHGESLAAPGEGANDNWGVLTTGGRLDWERRENALTVDTTFLTSRTRALWRTLPDFTSGPAQVSGGTSNTQEVAVLGRWINTRASGAALQVQAFVTNRQADVADVHEHEGVADLDVQYHASIGARHDVVVGGGHRRTGVLLNGSLTYTLNPPRSQGRVTNLFVQDEIALGKRVRVTLGTKLEHERVTRWSLQPTARVAWAVASGQQVWAAASRAVRTPSAADLGIRVNFAGIAVPGGPPVVLGIVGNPDYGTEKFSDLELGYRVKVGARAAVDVTAFRGRYHDLQTAEPMAPVFELLPLPAHTFIGTRLANLLAVDTRGLEVATHWIPVGWWRVDGSYSALTLVPHLDPASADAGAARFDGSAPRGQWQLQSSGRLGPRVHVSGSVFHTGRLRQLDVPAYTRVDARVEAVITDTLSVMATGQNLQAAYHREFGGDVSVQPTLVPRAIGVQLLWRFR